MVWQLPLRGYEFIESSKDWSFLDLKPRQTSLPIWPEHPGGFGAVRKHDVHSGIDFYCPEGTPVYTVERGIIIDPKFPFTGPLVNPAWTFSENTYAVLVQGKSGVVVYGEITPLKSLSRGQRIKAGKNVGEVKRVLVENKGRPMSMLHLELHEFWTGDDPVWELGGAQISGFA